MNILDKTIYHDIAYLVETMSENHLGVMKAVVGRLLYSRIPTINIEPLCRNWAIGKPKFYQLLRMMRGIRLINIIQKEEVEKPYSKGSKIFFADPTFYHVFEEEIGGRKKHPSQAILQLEMILIFL